MLPLQPEARGLQALMLYYECRRAARRDGDGRFVPLKVQNASLSSRDMIIEAENQLTIVSRAGVFGRFQCEAAIQSVHAQPPLTGQTNHAALATLYGLLADRCPSDGALVTQAAAMVEAGRPEQALAVLGRWSSRRYETTSPSRLREHGRLPRRETGPVPRWRCKPQSY